MERMSEGRVLEEGEIRESKVRVGLVRRLEIC
jgi:hypothetical protein